MIRDITSDDLPAVLALNNAHAMEVNALTADALAGLVSVAVHARVIDGGHGFLLAFSERTPVQGPNHAWFVASYPTFLYIDRIVIAPGSRGLGHARRLYEDLAAIAAGRPLCQYHVDGCEQLLGYCTGRELRAFCMDFFDKAGVFEKMRKLREDVDAKRPLAQNAESADHRISGAFVTSHRHSSGSDVEILHLGCSVAKP